MQALRRQLCSRWLRDVSVILRTGSELICSQSACVSSLKAVTIADSGLVPLPDTRRTSDASSSGREFPCSYRAAESVKPRFLSYSAFSFIRTWSSSSRLEDGADPSASTRSEEGLREGLAPRTRRRRKGETSGYEEGRETSNYKERGGGLGTFLAVSNREAVEYKRVGAMSPGPFRVPYKEVFATVELCGTQYKVSPGDLVYTQQLFGCDINDKISLGRVLLLGSRQETIIGRPLIPGASVDAVVEEHFLDGKVLAFKKRRRKNSRRLKGHRQPRTCLRILDVHGIEEQPAASADGLAA